MNLRQKIGSEESRYVLSLSESGCAVFQDKYPAVGHFHPINFYFQFKAAQVRNLEPVSSTQGNHLLSSFYMPTDWPELLFIEVFGNE